MASGGLTVSPCGAHAGHGVIQVQVAVPGGATGSARVWSDLPAPVVEQALAHIPAVLPSRGALDPQRAIDAALDAARPAVEAALGAASPVPGPGSPAADTSAPPAAGLLLAATSQAAAKALAATNGQELYRWLARDGDLGNGPRVPLPGVLLAVGGRTAPNRLDVAGVSIAALGAPSLGEARRAAVQVRQALLQILGRLGIPAGLQPDGALAPPLQAPEDVLDLVVDAVDAAGYVTGAQGVAIALDIDAGALTDGSRYRLNGTSFDAADWTQYLAHLAHRYPIWSLHDPTGRRDVTTWELVVDELSGTLQVVGDPELVSAAPGSGVAAAGTLGGVPQLRGTASILSVQRAGSVTAAWDGARRCRVAGADVVAWSRDADALDRFAADLSVAVGGSYLLGGPVLGSELDEVSRRLLQIASDAPALPFGPGTA